ncbi:hypothetical protein HYFRA_00000025 [Hymenoscyphus fraxineus]|uniref:2EXR domain-containing protein n=1 Tax=Hymenoscyphus fraxineus TaxID=746836 RepID=A0A9N9L4R5_9HELO|nr:hypothetical protein HYFRA_00000025 [Hymenoscyphus fraxineus]
MSEFLTTFRLFSQLPFDIRLLIWEEAIETLPGRIILLHYKSYTPPLAHPRGYGHTLQSKPNLYHACRESKKVYDAYQAQKRSGNSALFVGAPLSGDGRSEVYQGFPPVSLTIPMNFTKDILVFPRADDDVLEDLVRLIGSENRDKIRHFGSLVGHNLDAQFDTYFDLVDLQISFKNLETSSAVIDIECMQDTTLKSALAENAYTLVPVTGLLPDNMERLRKFYSIMDMCQLEEQQLHQHIPSSTATRLVKIEPMLMKSF